MKVIPALLLVLCVISVFSAKAAPGPADETPIFYSADNPYLQYTGRMDLTDPKKPRTWAPGAYMVAKFKGTSCSVIINDEVLYGTSHNYLEIIVDNWQPVRLQMTGKTDTIQVAKALPDREHIVVICKNTEAGIGYIEFAGIICKQLMPLPPKPSRKIEFIGNSITCGFGADMSAIPCGKGQWYDQHNAWLAYGPLTARTFGAQWHLSSVSGIGLIHSCCNMTITMPQVYDKVNMRTDSLAWNTNDYHPDLITVCLGQNDGVQDSTTFCSAYVQFLERLRGYHPKATIICLTSPMGNETLNPVLQRYLTGIVQHMNSKGDKKISSYFFSKRYISGCGEHPDLKDQEQIAKELIVYVRKLMKW
ncbi:MAG: SGNH/GDSL hydrolase family protein [Chitinophagaceae bacterium]